MMHQLKDKVAIITGASSGIGVAIAEKLAQHGVHVVLAARRKALLDQVVERILAKGKGKAVAIQTDVTQKEEVDHLIKQAIDRFGHVDIMINNAGVMIPDASIRGGKVEEWDHMIDVNIKGVLYGIHAVLPQMLTRSKGHIINTASVSGLEVSKTGAVYSATKFAVRAISMALEKELARTGVRMTNLSPGMVETERAALNREKRNLELNCKPLNPEDIADAVIYALSQPAHVNVNEITVRPV